MLDTINLYGAVFQWECKTDMDNAYRFGKVEVTCEGYDHPDDPYILRGSCGVRILCILYSCVIFIKHRGFSQQR